MMSKVKELYSQLKRIILSADVDEQEYIKAKEQISEDNRTNLLVFSIVTVLALITMCIVTVVLRELSAYFPIYITCTVLMVAICICAHTAARGNVRLTQFITYAFIIFLLLTGIGISTVVNVHETTATYIALLLAVPMLFTDRPYRIWLLLTGSTVVYVVGVVAFKDPCTWNTDIVNGVLFAILSAIVSTRLMVIKVQRICLGERVRKMAEIDLLTGLQNRNVYEQRLTARPSAAAKTVFCVYVDVNGLHHMNDTQGHAAGDRMLQFAATTLRGAFGKVDTYRIGGDEFVAIGEDRPEEQLQRMVAQFKQELTAVGYHAAVGVAVQPASGVNKEALVRMAEERMYDDKRDYYQRTGIERRKN